MAELLTYDVFRVRTGRGLVDFVGLIQAVHMTAAEGIARETVSYDPRTEHLDILVREDEDAPPPLMCLVCGEPAVTAYQERLDFPSCGSPRCELKMQGGIDAHDSGCNR